MDGSQPSIDTIVWNTNEFMAISKCVCCGFHGAVLFAVIAVVGLVAQGWLSAFDSDQSACLVFMMPWWCGIAAQHAPRHTHTPRPSHTHHATSPFCRDGTKLIHAEAGLWWYELANMTSGFDFVVGVLTSDLETNHETAFFGKPSQGSDASAFAVAVVDDNGSFVTQTTFKTPSPGTLNGAALINIAQYLVTTTDTVWFVDTEQNTLTPLATANSSSVVYSSPVVVGNDMFVAYFDGERAAVIYAKATSPSAWTDVTPFAEGPLTAAPIVLAVAGNRVWLAAGISAPSKTGSSAVYASTTGGQFELIANAATSCSQE